MRQLVVVSILALLTIFIRESKSSSANSNFQNRELLRSARSWRRPTRCTYSRYGPSSCRPAQPWGPRPHQPAPTTGPVVGPPLGPGTGPSPTAAPGLENGIIREVSTVQCRDTTPQGPTAGAPGASSCRYVFRVFCRKRKKRSASRNTKASRSTKTSRHSDSTRNTKTTRHSNSTRNTKTSRNTKTAGTPIAPGTPRPPGTPIAPTVPRPLPGSSGRRFPSLPNNFVCDTDGLPLPDQTELPAPSPPSTRPPGGGEPGVPGGSCPVVPDIIC
ncbi:hypothetical protein EB796_015614 [Bugula neritina]|uniref:Uncharacterized protein n=1 Tax=Bugula neritina TaxID=10212 RepID=A0A7J7JL49_BUGNE|nr:hypothetical protein EB796_015614 [Bugula neritina]